MNNETGFIGDENPQVASLARFLEIILRNGVRSSGLTTAQREDIIEFTKQSMFSDIMKQLVSGISFDILQSPMFNFTKDNNVPYMSLVDWAPLPTEDEAECGYDPHILAIDTFRRRIREDYENKIECSPIENEISANALGRKDLSSLEAASMSGLIMTTLRAYGLEQLVREVFPVSTFIGREFLSQVHVKYIVDQVRDKMYEKSSAYFEAFLGQLEKTFEDRMEEFSPYGSIPTVISEAEAIGVKWVYAQAALDEFNGTAEGSSETVAAITSAPLTPPAELSPDVPVNPAAELFGEPDEGIDQIFATLNSTSVLGTSPSQLDQPAQTSGDTPTQNFEIVSGDPADTETVTPTPGFCEDENSAVVIPTTSLYNIMENRFSFLVEEQLYSVLDKLQDLTSFEGEKSFYDRFISKGMPLFDIQKNPGDPRFSEADGVDFIDLEQMEIDRQYAVYSAKYNEWFTAKQNFALAASAVNLVGFLLSPAILASPLTPVGKTIPDGESDVFYKAAGENGKEYKYFNTNFVDVLSDIEIDPFSPPDWVTFENGIPTDVDVRGFIDSIFNIEDTDTSSNLVPTPRVKDFVTGLDRDSTTKLNSVKPTRGELEVPFNLSEQQGQIILEKYVKTTTPPSLGAFSTQDNFTGQRYADTVEQPESLGRISEPGSSFQQLASTSAITVSEVLSPRESVNTSARSCKPGVPSEGVSIEEVISSHESTEKLGGEINIAREKIWNISDFESHIRDLAISNPDMLLSDKYEKVSFGLRMVYVTPLNGFIETEDDPTSLTNQRKLATEEFIFDESVIDSSKSFIQYEELEIQKKMGDFTSQEGIDNPIFVAPKPQVDAEGSSIEPVKQKRVLRLFPLEAVEMSDRQLPPDTKMSDFLTKLSVGDDEKYQNVDKLYQNKYMAILQNDLKQSSTFNYLFRYSVPGDFLLSFVSIYSNLVNEIDETFFDKTKFELKSLFEVLENGGDYTFETSEEKKSGGNRGAYARASANYGSEGAARDPGLFDLAVKTPKLIFKGLTEFIDPCISVASKIVKAGNAGLLLPQIMKVLNPDGTAGGVNDENYFLTDIVLPRGSVPPPIGDILGKNPTVIQENVLPTDSTRDYPGNNEIVTFRLRDSITKGSEEGSSLFDKYLQKVFFNYKPNKNEIFNVYSDPAHSGEIDDLGNFGTEKTRLFQRFASGLVIRDVQTMSTTILKSYMEDLETVRLGIIEELEGRYSNIRDYLTKPFTPFVFKTLREADDPFLCDAGDEVLAILKGEQPVNPNNFMSTNGTSLATGNIQSVNPDTGLLEVVPDEHTIDWVIWGNVNGAFTVPAPPNPEPILPGYPLPLPITPVAMSLLPADMLGGYGPGPPHSPLGHIYHAIVAAEGLSNLTLEQKAVQREREGLENKKKLRGKLCIDIDQIAAEERKRRGME